MDMESANGQYEPLIGYVILEQCQAAVDTLGHRLIPVKRMDLKQGVERRSRPGVHDLAAQLGGSMPLRVSPGQLDFDPIGVDCSWDRTFIDFQ